MVKKRHSVCLLVGKLALDAGRLGVVFKSPLSRSRSLQDVYRQLIGMAIVHQVPGSA